MINKKIKFIRIAPKFVYEIASLKEVNKGTVYDALTFRTNSELAQSIRDMAMKNYNGRLANKVVFIDK